MTTPPATPPPGSQPTQPPVPPAPHAAPGTPPAPAAPQTSTAPAGTHPVGAPASSPIDTFVKGATDAAQQARAQVARAAESNRGRIAATVDRLGATIDQRTGGRYHQQVEKAKGWVDAGIDAVAGTPHPTRTPSASHGPAASAGKPAHTAGAPTPPGAAATPVTPSKPAEGWHRGPGGEWVRS